MAASVVLSPLLLVAIGLVGPVAVVLPAAVAVGWYLVARPDHAVLALLATTIVLETDSESVFGFTRGYWSFIPGLPVKVHDLIIGCLAVGLVMHWNRARPQIRAQRIWLLPLALVTAGLLSGTATGYLGGGELNTLLNSFRVFVLLLITPALVILAVDWFGLVDRMLKLWFVLVGVKCGIAVVGWFAGAGRAFRLGSTETRLTFYTPTMNQFALLLILGVLATRLSRGSRPSRWELIAAVSASASLLLSFRRSMWIAAVLGLVLVLLVASGRRGRPLVVLCGSLILIGALLSFTAGGATTTENPVVQRAQIQNTAEDRYRFDEQANVLEEIQRRPLTGLGLGVPWEARQPLSLEFEGGRNYVHVALLFFWLKLGPMGMAGYVALVATTAVLGFRLWARGTGRASAAGLAIATGELGRAVAELTGTFTGASDRFTVAQMLVVGWLAASLLRIERDPDRPLLSLGSRQGARETLDPA